MRVLWERSYTLFFEQFLHSLLKLFISCNAILISASYQCIDTVKLNYFLFDVLLRVKFWFQMNLTI